MAQQGGRKTTIAGDELLEVLLSRRAIVASLTGEPHTKPELVAECDVSRSTIDRGIRALEGAGIVARGEDGRYELTLFGEVTVREFERSLAHMDTLASVRDHIAEIASEAGVDARVFEDATIHHSAGTTIATVLEVFTDATELWMVNPSLSLILMGLVSDRGVFSDGEVTALIRRDMLTELAAFSPQIDETSLQVGISLYEIDGPFPFSFALVDRPTGRSFCLILGNDRNGVAVVETGTDAAMEWGTGLYARVLDDAHPVPSGELKAVFD